MPLQRSFVWTVALLLLATLPGCVTTRQPKTALDVACLRRDLERVRVAFEIPGMAVVAVQDGAVVFRAGFGHRSVENGQPFTPETLCLMASTTKAFTAGMIGTLVDDGELDWTRPVRHYWPPFKMVDEFASRELTLEDMLCHRTGLPDHENLLAHGVGRELADKEKARAYRRALLERLAHFEPAHSFRSQWQYQDIVYTCVGAIAEQATGKHFEDLVRERILDPLGMEDSTFSRPKARETGRLAQGYASVNGRPQPIPFNDTRYLAPCGGLYSTADEMARWMQLQIDEGKWKGEQVISKESMAWIHRARIVFSDDGAPLQGGMMAYAHGWKRQAFRGHPALEHGGSFNGYRTNVIVIPQRRAGVVVLTNLNLTLGMVAATSVVMDRLLGSDDVDAWIDHYRKIEKQGEEHERAVRARFEAGRDLSSPPRHELAKYVGRYRHSGYGTFEVMLKEGRLQQTYDGRTHAMKRYRGETFETRFQSTENRLLFMAMTFVSAGDEVVALEVPIVPGIPTPSFARER